MIKSLYISNTRYYMEYSDNYFDVLPGQKVLIKMIDAPVELREAKNTFVFRSYREVYDPIGLKVRFEND